MRKFSVSAVHKVTQQFFLKLTHEHLLQKDVAAPTALFVCFSHARSDLATTVGQELDIALSIDVGCFSQEIHPFLLEGSVTVPAVPSVLLVSLFLCEQHLAWNSEEELKLTCIKFKQKLSLVYEEANFHAMLVAVLVLSKIGKLDTANPNPIVLLPFTKESANSFQDVQLATTQPHAAKVLDRAKAHLKEIFSSENLETNLLNAVRQLESAIKMYASHTYTLTPHKDICANLWEDTYARCLRMFGEQPSKNTSKKLPSCQGARGI